MKKNENTGDVFDKSRFQELLVYAVMWLIILLVPVIHGLLESVKGTGNFSWANVSRWWVGMLPFFVLYLLHNHLVIPRFLFHGKIKRYALCVLILLISFGVYQYIAFDIMRKNRPEMMAPAHRHGAPRPHPDSLKSISGGMPPKAHPPGNILYPAPPRPKGKPAPMQMPAPVMFNTIIALMLLGLNLAIVLLFKSSREQERLKALENARLQDELKYLKAQINPHFFMNMLNNIHTMVEVDADKAQYMILELSKLMRYVLYEGNNSTTTVASEVNFLSSYVSLMRQRYPDSKVDIKLAVPEQPSDILRLPPLLFIPFAENAFKHGISYRRKSEVEISLEEKEGTIYFFCRNTKPQLVTDNKRVGGVGLTNIRRRLDLLYDKNYFLEIKDNTDDYSVKLIIPCL